TLRIVETGAEYRLPLEQNVFMLGKTRSCHVLVRDDRVSSNHIEIWRVPSGLHVIDKGSKNGLWHRGKRVNDLLVAVGGAFELAETIRIRVFDDRLRNLRRILARGLGVAQHAT